MGMAIKKDEEVSSLLLDMENTIYFCVQVMEKYSRSRISA